MTGDSPDRVVLAPRGTLPPIDAEPLPPEDFAPSVLVPNAPGNVQPLSGVQVEVFEAQAARWQTQVEGLRREIDDLRRALMQERTRVRSLTEAIGVVNNLVTQIMNQGER